MMVAEFDSVAAATACHDGPAYQAALEVFINAAERDFRIIESLESRNRTFVPGRMKPVSNRRDNASSRARAAARGEAVEDSVGCESCCHAAEVVTNPREHKRVHR